jgi:hypothetical protein
MDEHTDSLVSLDLQPNRATLRGFGWAVAVLCLGRTLWHWHQAHVLALPTFSLAFIVLAVALWAPTLLRAPYALLNTLTYPVRWLFAFSVLALLYFAVITPMAWLLRLSRRFQSLDRTDAPGVPGKSAWQPVAPRSSRDLGKADYFRQF